MTGSNEADRTARLREDAAAWLIRVQSADAVEADWLALEAWLAASPEHRLALDDVEQVARDYEEAAEAIRAAERARPPLARRFGLSGRAYAAMAACFATAVIAVWALIPPAPSVQAYATAVGQTRSFVLPDGSRIRLNSDSRLVAAVGRRSRRITLERGEAAFDVTYDASHPFVVSVADQRITVLGTAFDILRFRGRVVITVGRGAVRVTTRDDQSEPPAFDLGQGEQSQHVEGASTSNLARVRADDAFAWLKGYAVYQGQPLSAVAADLSRYFPRPIIVRGAAGRLTFSGIIILNNEDSVLARLQTFLPVRAAPDRGTIVLSLK